MTAILLVISGNGQRIEFLSMALEKGFPHVEILLLSKFEFLILKHR